MIKICKGGRNMDVIMLAETNVNIMFCKCNCQSQAACQSTNCQTIAACKVSC